MKTLITDMGGVIYSFDSTFDPNKHQEAFDIVLKKQNMFDSDLKSQLEIELKSIQSKNLVPYPVEIGITNLNLNILKLKIVIVSTSLVRTSKLILEKFGINTDNIDFFDMSDFGSKKDKEAWKTIFKKYKSIDYIVEDGEINLKAANLAAQELGFSPKTFTSMPDLSLK